MGEYWRYVCVTPRGVAIAMLSPICAFGGLKWDEFVGTEAGKRLLALLNEAFCPAGAHWARVSDYGDVRDVSPAPSATLYDQSDTLPDLALHPELRRRALARGIGSERSFANCDARLPLCREWAAQDETCSMIRYEAPTLPLALPQGDLRRWRRLRLFVRFLAPMLHSLAMQRAFRPGGPGYEACARRFEACAHLVDDAVASWS